MLNRALNGRKPHVEDETSPRHGLQELVLVVTQRVANLADALRQRVIGHERVGPHGPKQIFFGYEGPLMFVEIEQYLKRFGSEPDFLATAQETRPLEAECENARGILP